MEDMKQDIKATFQCTSCMTRHEFRQEATLCCDDVELIYVCPVCGEGFYTKIQARACCAEETG